ncbi:sensor histidine kinase [Formosa sp. 3Alg 14/1]|uniref:sensor histidine kinase n=1 Tax=Formosa sp. 3Alg 14/1 TaxID=3382190 RepID=UPI0039BEA6A4
MIRPELPENECNRQLAVDKYQLIDTLPEESYDNITDLMAYICDVPISLVTLLDRDRNFFKSYYGVPFTETTRDLSFCGHAINSDDLLTVVEDSRLDERFHDNPLVLENNIVFYAGAALVNPEGYKLGMLCVYDTKPRTLSEEQKKALLAMAKQVTMLMEQRYQNILLNELQDKLKKRNEDLEKFARVVSHDLKSPLANIISLTELLEDENQGNLNEESQQYLDYLKSSSYSLKNYVDGLLKYYKSDELTNHTVENIVVQDLYDELKKVSNPEKSVVFHLESNATALEANKSALMHVLINLVSNSIKYNSKPKTEITINISENESDYTFSVQDNGDGIPEKFIDKIFNLFTIVGIEDKYGNIGTGIGLASVKKIVDHLGGDIKVTSTLGVGSTFLFTISKK